MTRSQFFQHFDLLADQPDVVAKMRELILQLAIQGRLLANDAKDTSARKLAAQIRAAKETDFAAISSHETPFKLPVNWEWVRVGEAMNLINGRAFKPTDWSQEGLPIVRIQNLNNPDAPFNYCNFEVDEKVIIQTGDFLISWSGTPGTSFGAFIWNRGKAVLNQHIFRVELVGDAYTKDFLRLAVNGRLEEMIAKAHGAVGLQHITKGKLEMLVLPLPPLAEQRRIVAKVDELLALCDELAARQQARHAARAQLQKAALHHLLAAREPHTFAPAWQRVRDQFHLLHDTPDAIPQLRQAILQLAVQGRLVPQNPKDESGAKLVARLSRKELPDADHILDENFHSSWSITAFANLANIRSGVTKGRNLAGRKTKSFPYLRVANVQRGYLDLEVMKDIEIPVEELEKFRLQPNDLLVTEGGDWDKVGRTAIWRGEIADCIHQNHVFRGRLVSGELQPEWFMLYFNSPVGRRYFETAAKQTTNLASINATELRECPVPIPPLAEQKRIVARVEALLRQCDALEAQLHHTRTLGAHLLDSTLDRLLAA